MKWMRRFLMAALPSIGRRGGGREKHNAALAEYDR
jgi:hypothetical protein